MKNEYSSWIASTAKHMQKKHKMVNEAVSGKAEAVQNEICDAIEAILKKNGYSPDDINEMMGMVYYGLFSYTNPESGLLDLL